jgi:hypothetical protein
MQQDNKIFKRIIIGAVLLITIIKLNLIGSGFFAFPDEFRYTLSGKAFQDIMEFKIRDANEAIFLTQGRPADAIINIIPNAIQFVTASISKLNWYESGNSYPLFIFNFIIYCLILYVHFKFTKLILKDDLLAWICILFYGSLTNSYLYLKHALPYDAALLIFYTVIYKIILYTEEEGLSYKRSLFLGFFSFFGYLVYPGYFPLLILTVLLILLNKTNAKNIRRRLFNLSCFAFGCIVCLSLFEFMSRLAGRSYIGDALILSKTIIQGSFDESFSFIIKYLYEVEGLSGMVLIFGLIGFYLILIYQLVYKINKPNDTIILLNGLLAVLFLFYASMGYFLHQMVQYGRLLHQYFPFLCLFSLYSINKSLSIFRKKKELVLSFISLIFIIGFGVSFNKYIMQSFPRDVAWQLSKKVNMRSVERISEYENYISMMPSIEQFQYSSPSKDTLPENVKLINAFIFYPFDDMKKYHAYRPPENYKLIYSGPHYLNFKAYQFEGYGRSERRNMDRANLQIEIFAKKDYGVD